MKLSSKEISELSRLDTKVKSNKATRKELVKAIQLSAKRASNRVH